PCGSNGLPHRIATDRLSLPGGTVLALRPLVLSRPRRNDAEPLLRGRRHLWWHPRQSPAPPPLRARIVLPPSRRRQRAVALVLTRLRTDAVADRSRIRTRRRNHPCLLRSPRPVWAPQFSRARDTG